MKKMLVILCMMLMLSGCYYVKEEDKAVRKDKDNIVFTEKELDKIEEKLEYDYVGIEEVDIEVAGKIIYMEIEYRDNVIEEDAMEDCMDYISYFDGKKLDSYDLNIILEGENWIVSCAYNDEKLVFDIR